MPKIKNNSFKQKKLEGTVVEHNAIPRVNDLIIRYPKFSDAQVMSEYINSLSEERTYVTFQGEKISLKEEQDFLKNELEKINERKNVMLLAFIGGQLVGISGIQSKSRVASHEGAFGISVSKKHRGKGIGKVLLSTILKEARNISTLRLVTLEVFSTNKTALNLYQSFGFIEYGRLPEGIYYNNRYFDNIYMYKKIY